MCMLSVVHFFTLSVEHVHACSCIYAHFQLSIYTLTLEHVHGVCIFFSQAHAHFSRFSRTLEFVAALPRNQRCRQAGRHEDWSILKREVYKTPPTTTFLMVEGPCHNFCNIFQFLRGKWQWAKLDIKATMFSRCIHVYLEVWICSTKSKHILY